jgi:hypothetical protein
MKKSMQIQFAVMFSLFAASIFMTNEAVAQTQTTKSFAEKAVAKMQQAFNFKVAATPCFSGGTSYSVQIAQPQKYAYAWEVNGNNGGHRMNIECACGNYAKVRVMRLSDGLQATRTIKLGKCGGSDN